MVEKLCINRRLEYLIIESKGRILFFLKRGWVWSRHPALLITRMASFCFILSLCRLVVFREHILVFFRKFLIVSVRLETVLFVSVVSIKVRNTETNRNFFFWFQETNRNKRETDLVLVCFGSNWKYFFSISRTPYLGPSWSLRSSLRIIFKNLRTFPRLN